MRVNFNSPSFKATYRFDFRDFRTVGNIQDHKLSIFCSQNDCFHKSKYTPSVSRHAMPTAESASVVVSDEQEPKLLAFCRENGIIPNLQDDKVLLDEKAIIARTIRHEDIPKGFTIRLLDMDKFEELESRQRSNGPAFERSYKKYYKKEVDGLIKSGYEIPATSFYIIPITYIDKALNSGDINDLEDDSIKFDFTGVGSDIDYYNFFAMKDLGMRKIPVCVPTYTYELGKKLGLLE